MNQVKGPTLDDVLDTYLSTVEKPTLASAREWGQRFPEHADALRSLVVNWKLADRIQDGHDIYIDDDEGFMQKSMAISMRLLDIERKKCMDAKHKSVEVEVHLKSLFASAKAVGLTTDGFAYNLGISAVLVTKLHRRLIEPTSIPRPLVEAIALELRETLDSVSLYLAQSPATAAGALYRAQTKPKASSQENFFTAVRSDTSLDEESRAHWLSFEPQGRSSP